MRGRCFWGGGQPVGCWGIALVAIGLILLILSLPYWLWMALVGVILIVVGLFVLRFG